MACVLLDMIGNTLYIKCYYANDFNSNIERAGGYSSFN